MHKISFFILAIVALVLLGFTYSFKAKSSTENTSSSNYNEQNNYVNEDERGQFQRRWTYQSETSAVIYWQLADISTSAKSYVEYGKTKTLGSQTKITKKPRWSQYHQLKDLNPETIYYYRMVMINPETNKKTKSEIIKINLKNNKDAIRIPEDMPEKTPYILNKPGAYYILTKDIIAKGTAIEIAGKNITLDLDGHTVTFGEDTDEQVYGVRFADWGNSILCNGYIVQGKRSRDYSAAITSLDRTVPTEIFGISTDVHLPNALPIYMSHANKVTIHHNYIYSRVTEIECRHHPGNEFIRIYTYAGDIHIHDNLLTEGCHWGIYVRKVSQTVKNVEIDHNDIQHHQQYVNGYAIQPCEGAEVHHNKITSSGRGIHVTRDGVRVYNNYLDTKGHQQLSDYPAKTRPFQHRLIECHGIKLEGRLTKNCKIYDNFVRITQYLPVDSDGEGAPEDKMDNGVYIRSEATSMTAGKLTDTKQNWEKDRWRYYYVKYNPDLPPAKITSNNSNTLYADFGDVKPGEYTIYMKWTYVPPTPLNIACYDPNGMNEIYNNTFIGITHYNKTRHGDYGDTGEWATSLMFIWMKYGLSDMDKYAAWIHNNQFFSNDLFLNTGVEVNMTVRVENNTFTLLKKPFATAEINRIRGVGQAFEKQVRNGNNVFNE
jgi:hypothetical protein